MNRFPNIYFIAAAKSGSSGLFWTLSKHPELNPSKEKETDFLNSLTAYNLLEQKEPIDNIRDRYMSNWDLSKTGILYEISPGYSQWYEGKCLAIENLLKIHPNKDDIKIIFISRDPIDRYISQVTHQVARYKIAVDDDINESFIKDINWVDHWEKQRRTLINIDPSSLTINLKLDSLKKSLYLHRALYYNVLSYIYDRIDPNKVLVMEYEDYKKDYKTFIKKILKFFNVSTNVDWDVIENVKANTSSLWKKHINIDNYIKPEHIDFLKCYYYKHNYEYYKLTGINYNETYT